MSRDGERGVIDWDYNATTPLHPQVAAAMAQALTAQSPQWGNPSSVHQRGRAARVVLDDARQRIARALDAEPKEVCFTSSGSEANALALRGMFAARPVATRRRIVSSAIEHPAVLGLLGQLEKEGADVVRLLPNAQGVVEAEALDAALTTQTAVCSLMWANNETGALQPVERAAQWCKERGVLFHTDAVQAVGKVPVRFHALGADALSLSAHKFGGPAGAGAVLLKRGINVQPLVAGHQELGRRGGTQNLLGAIGLAAALELAVDTLDQNARHWASLRNDFEERVMSTVKGAVIQSRDVPRVANTSHVRFEGMDGEALLIALDLEGICASSGAACSSGTSTPSHVLRAMGLTVDQTQSALRFSMGPSATAEEVSCVLGALARAVRAQATTT